MTGRLAMLLLACACAGARATIVAPTSEYPISMSAGLRDADDHVVSTRGMEPLDQFVHEFRTYGTLYSAVQLGGEHDISAEVNRQVSLLGGNAVANLEITSRGCALNKFFGLSFLPFWVGCTIVTLRGDVFRIDPTLAMPGPSRPAGALAGSEPWRGPGLGTTAVQNMSRDALRQERDWLLTEKPQVDVASFFLSVGATVSALGVGLFVVTSEQLGVATFAAGAVLSAVMAVVIAFQERTRRMYDARIEEINGEFRRQALAPAPTPSAPVLPDPPEPAPELPIPADVQ
jgi:hypothetical protein